MDLKAASRTAEKIGTAVYEALQMKASEVDLRDLTKELIGRIEDEIGAISFLSLSTLDAKRWSAQMPFGEEVYSRFPSAIVEIEEASKCLAVERSTAAVFHLMRTMEVALKVAAVELGIPYAPSWEPYLKQIHTRIDQKWRKKGVQWKRDEPFFREVLGHLQAVKVAWRNPTMHVVNQYTLEQAEDIFNAVRGFMRHLATRLSESSAKKPGRKKRAAGPRSEA